MKSSFKKIILFLSAFFLQFSYASAQNSALEQLYSLSPAFEFETPLPSSYGVDNAGLKGAEALTGQALFEALHSASEIKNPHDYNDAKKYMFSVVDNARCPNGQNGVTGFYSLICVNGASGNGGDYKEKGDQNGDGCVDSQGMNVEHLWPQSFFGEQLPMRSDLHHLRPTFMKPNNERATYPFVQVISGIKYSTNAGAKLGSGGFEPPDSVKGDVARAMLYFLTRYYDKQIRQGGMDYKYFLISQVDTLLRWNKADPPDQSEKRRNDLVEKYQGNRNPYIDDYTLADKVGAAVFKSY